MFFRIYKFTAKKMGSVFSRRGKKPTIEILQDIEKDIDDLETSQADKDFNRRRFTGYLIIISVLLFIGSGIYWYLYQYPSTGLTWRHYFIFLPLVSIYTVSLWALKWLIYWWYDQSLSIDERKLHRLRRRKREILDAVKDKETYKVAKEILERFDPQMRKEKAAKKAREFQQQLQMMRRYASLEGSALTTPSPDQTLRNRSQRKSRSPSPTFRQASSHQNMARSISNLQHTDSTLSVHPPPPHPSPLASATPPPPPLQLREPVPIQRLISSPPTSQINQQSASERRHSLIGSPQAAFVHSFVAPFPPQQPVMIPTPGCLPRPVIPRDRSAFDRMIDFVLGEGPANRYALICHHCRSHNGMALKEEVETMAFRCCYCFTFNPARRLAQQLGQPESSIPTREHSVDEIIEADDTAEAAPPVTTPSTTKNDVDLFACNSAPPKRGVSRTGPPSRCSTDSDDSIHSAPI